MRSRDVSRYDKIKFDRNYEDIFQFILQSKKTKLIVDLALVVRTSRRFVDRIDFSHTIFDLEIILCKNQKSTCLMTIQDDRNHEVTQIIVICQNLDEIAIVLQIMFSLLKCNDYKQKFLIMSLVSSLR